MFVPEVETMLAKRGKKKAVAMLKPSRFLHPWPNPKHSTPLGTPSSSSSTNDMNSVCSILELLDLHICEQESSLLAYVGHSERNAYLHISFYSNLLAFVIIVCKAHFLIYFVCFSHTNADGRGKSSKGAQFRHDSFLQSLK